MITFESLDIESSFLVIRYMLRIRFVYEGHRIKVKVTGTKKAKIPIPTM